MAEGTSRKMASLAKRWLNHAPCCSKNRGKPLPAGAAEVELASEEKEKSEKDLTIIEVATEGEEPLLIPSFFFPWRFVSRDSICDSVHEGANSYGKQCLIQMLLEFHSWMHPMARHVCEMLNTSFGELAKPKESGS